MATIVARWRHDMSGYDAPSATIRITNDGGSHTPLLVGRYRKRAVRNLVISKTAFIELYHALGVSVFIC